MRVVGRLRTALLEMEGTKKKRGGTARCVPEDENNSKNTIRTPTDRGKPKKKKVKKTKSLHPKLHKEERTKNIKKCKKGKTGRLDVVADE